MNSEDALLCDCTISVFLIDWCISYGMINWCFSVLQQPVNTEEPYSVIGWCISVVQHPVNTEEALLSDRLVYFSCSTPSGH